MVTKKCNYANKAEIHLAMKNISDLAKLQPGANKHKRHSKLQNPVIKNGKNPVIKNGKNAVLQKIYHFIRLLDPHF